MEQRTLRDHLAVVGILVVPTLMTALPLGALAVLAHLVGVA